MGEPFRQFTSRVVPLRAENVDTDQVVPARYLKVTDKAGLADALFRDWRFNEGGTLRELANSTHGAYVDASEWVDLPRVLAATVEKGRKGRFVEHSTVRFAERFQWALAPALLCLIASFWLEFPVRPKARAVRLGGTPGASSRARPTLAAVSAAALLLLAPARPAAGQGAPDPAASLSKVVGRLSSQERCSALDWAEFGRDTATWGQHLRSSGEQVPEGPVRDALAAVDIGERSDPKASDWPGLRSELEDLLQKKDEQKKQDQKKQDQKDSQQQNQDQSQDQDQKQKQDQQQRQDQKQSSPDSARPQTSKGEPQVPREPKPSEQQKAFGDMGAPSPSPAPREERRIKKYTMRATTRSPTSPSIEPPAPK